MILLAVITACHDRPLSYWCIQAQLACHDISRQWTLRRAINKADELQTAAAITPRALNVLRFDCVSQHSTFYMTAQATLYASSSCFFQTVCQNNTVESGRRWVFGWRSRGANCCDYHRWGHGEGDAWQVELSLKNAAVRRKVSVFTAQVYWMP